MGRMGDRTHRADDLTVETVAELGEFGLVDRITSQLVTTDAVVLGAGDDAAEIALDGNLVVTTDVLVDLRHFRRDWSTAHEIGRKAAASNLSDLNAMGAEPLALTIGLAVPGDLPVAWVDELVRGIVEESSSVDAAVVGGDVTASDAVTIAITALEQADATVPRSGAAAGDRVAFAGTLGLAAAGYAALSRGFRSPRAAVEAHRVPTPPYGQGAIARAAGASAMIDVSDGLLADLGHIARASGVRIDLDTEYIPIDAHVITVAEALGRHPVSFVLSGGDDYALVGTFPDDVAIPDGWTRIGTVSEVAAGDHARVTVDGEPWDGDTDHQHFR